MSSERKRKNMRYGALIGAVVGVAVFAATYAVNETPVYIIFIPIAAAMGWAAQYVKDEDLED